MDKLKKIGNIFLIIIDVIATLAIIVVISTFVQTKILKKNYANFFGYSIFKITTGSMSGAIEINDAVIVRQTKDVNIDDMIAFTEGDNIITHRVVGKDNDIYRTRGDANTGLDRPVNKSDVIGKVVKVIPQFGVWVQVFSDKGVVTCIIMTLIFLGFTISIKDDKILRRVKRRRKSTNEKKEKEE